MHSHITRNAIVVLGLTILLVLPSARGDEQAEFLIAGVVESAGKIGTMQCEVEESQQFSSGKQVTDRFRWRYKEGREWMERISTTRRSVPWDVIAWDGKLVRALKTEVSDKEGVRLLGAITPEFQELDDTPFGTWLRSVACGMANVATFYEAEVAATEELNGYQCKVIEIRPKSEGGELATVSGGTKPKRLWVAPGVFLLLRYENFLNTGEPWCRYDFEYAKVGDVYYPKVIRKEFFGETQCVVTLSVSDVTINAELPDGDLELDFPKGTHVLDHIARRYFTVGAPTSLTAEDTQDVAGDLASEGLFREKEKVVGSTDEATKGVSEASIPDAQLAQQLSGFEGDSARSHRRSVVVLLVILAVAATAFVAWRVVRKRCAM